MSRIGKAPINVPAGVTVNITEASVSVKGAKGELTQEIDPCVKVALEGDVIELTRESDHKDHRAKHGLYRALISNMITGVTEGYKKALEFHGVGFRASAQGQRLEMMVGYSHPIILEIAPEVKLTAVTEKGKAPVVTLESHDKQLIGQVAAKIRSYRKPEPYKGKGIRYQGEEIRRKAGKSASK